MLHLGGVALLALVVRVAYLSQLHGTLPLSTLILDGRVFDIWAQQIAAGNWLGSEVFYQAPLYPYFLAVIYTLGGHNVMLVRAVQTALSIASCVQLAWAGARFFNRWTGTIAGVLLALYPVAWFFDSLVQKAALDLWFMTLLLALLGALQGRRASYLLVGAGMVLGAFVLSRENAGLIYPIIVAHLWIAPQREPAARRLGHVALFTAGVALMLLPVVWRNHHVGGEFVLATSLGPNLYIGNHAGASGRYEPLVTDRADPRFERADAARLAEQAVGAPLTPSQVSSYWLRRALADIRAQPGAWLRLLGWKLLMVFNTTELEDGEGIEVYGAYASLLGAFYRVLNFGVVLPLAVLGIWATRRAWRRLWVLYAIAAALAASTALFFVFARFRFTFVPIVLLFAAAALNAVPAMIASWRSGRWLRTWGPGCALAGAVAVLSNYPLGLGSQDHVTYVNLGMGLLADGRPADAIEPLRRAVALRPSSAGAHHNLGQALMLLNRADEAVAEYELALRADPNFAMSHAALGHYHYVNHRPAEARTHLQRAVDLVPELPLLRVQLADVLANQNDPSGAIAQLREGLRLDPDAWMCA